MLSKVPAPGAAVATPCRLPAGAQDTSAIAAVAEPRMAQSTHVLPTLGSERAHGGPRVLRLPRAFQRP